MKQRPLDRLVWGFVEATHAAPSGVFLDEIDAIAPRRDKVSGEDEKRLVAQLLAER